MIGFPRLLLTNAAFSKGVIRFTGGQFDIRISITFLDIDLILLFGDPKLIPKGTISYDMCVSRWVLYNGIIRINALSECILTFMLISDRPKAKQLITLSKFLIAPGFILANFDIS